MRGQKKKKPRKLSRIQFDFFFCDIKKKSKNEGKGLGMTTFLQSDRVETGNNHQTWRTRTGMMDFLRSSLSLTMSSIIEARITMDDIFYWNEKIFLQGHMLKFASCS